MEVKWSTRKTMRMISLCRMNKKIFSACAALAFAAAASAIFLRGRSHDTSISRAPVPSFGTIAASSSKKMARVAYPKPGQKVILPAPRSTSTAFDQEKRNDQGVVLGASSTQPISASSSSSAVSSGTGALRPSGAAWISSVPPSSSSASGDEEDSCDP